MQEIAGGLREIKATTLQLLDVLIRRRIVSKATIAENLGVSRQKVDGLLGKPGKSNMKDTLEIGQVAKLLETFTPLIDEEMLAEDSRVKTLYDTLMQGITSESSEPILGSEFEAFEKNAVRPKADMELALGHYLVFRRLPNSDEILVSALHCSYDHQRGLAVWENYHKINHANVPYKGIVSAQDGHFLLIGQSIDGVYINALSIRRPSTDLDFRLGIALVETENIPTICRIFLKKQNVRNLKALETYCGLHSLQMCLTKFHLRFESDVDILPYKKGDMKNVDNKKAVTTEAY
ncbi:MAG: hypothetical protein ABJ360_25740 [Roseobacter sp.]|uniref:hypothetical protein n=1 Tax=Roseibium sp. TaxID=1936156 RepID=UPI0032668F26